MDLNERNSRHDLVNKEVRDGVLRVIKSQKFEPSEHKLFLSPNNQANQIFQNHKVEDLKAQKSVQETHYTLHIPHIKRAEFAKKFKIVEENQDFEKVTQLPIQQNYQTRKRKYQRDFYENSEEVSPSNNIGKFLEIGKLLTTAGVIFVVLFLGLNFSAFKQITENWLHPDKYAEKQIALEETLIENRIPKPNLLPTAGMKRENRKSFPALNIAIVPIENRIIIPKIGKNIPIISIQNEALLNEDWKQLEKDIQQGLREGVVHYPGTAIPSQNGNFFVTGHSSYYPWDDGKYKDVFALLHNLEVGDEYTIYWNQKKYNYIIRERKVVNPKDTSTLDQPKEEKISTLMTCTPLGTAKNRLILVAEQI